MRFFKFSKQDKNELQKRFDDAEAVKSMQETEGWKIIENHLRNQLETYKIDNATNATDWNDYLKKSGKIFGIQLLLTDIDDFVRQGEEAEEELEKLKG